MKTTEIRKRVGKAFAKLRKTGLVCRRRFWCCMGCAIEALGPMVKKAKARGAVYYHKQDEDNFREGRGLSIRYWSVDADTKKGHKNHAGESLGWQVAATLREQGLVVDYDGDSRKTVEVKVKESLAAISG